MKPATFNNLSEIPGDYCSRQNRWRCAFINRKLWLVRLDLNNLTEAIPFDVGARCEIYDDFHEHQSLKCTGNVEKVTSAWIHVRNQHGNLCKFRTKDLLCEGHAWPYVTSALRPAR